MNRKEITQFIQFPHESKDDIKLQMYKEFDQSIFIQLIHSYKRSEFYDIIEKRTYIYFTILKKYQLPMENEDLMKVQVYKELIHLISENLPLTTIKEIQLDHLSYYYFYLTFHSRKDIFDNIESIIFLHRLYLTSPFNHFSLLQCKNIIQTSSIPLVEVPFQKISQLLPLYKYRLKNGYLLIPSNELIYGCFIYCIFNPLKQPKFIDLLLLRNEPPFLLQPLLSVLPKTKQQTILDNTRELSVVLSKLPACMYHIHSLSSGKYQMKYDTRRQIVIFLKNAGVDANVCMEYMRQRVDLMRGKEKKQLEYFVQHCYGLKGSHINFSPEKCKSIQQMNIKPGEVCGCIFNSKQYKESERLKWLKDYMNYLNIPVNLQLSLSQKFFSLSPNQCCSELLKYSCSSVDVDIEDISYPNWFLQEKEKLDRLSVLSQIPVCSQQSMCYQ
ncbi:hypothetical protein CL6EHI_008590 [Entamoeba histolytica]|uniref:DNA primase large subunit C-terminal domain-containing protein n=2 Tax=Entamoeba histolytica TaxID=5759 RepID=C4M0M3_ENTH1|nr:hypothetical protein EHI_008590 [Entamoeba histolytica HM-1:IMSS]EAL45763.2 hypothetical protein EHI_008590 [Entamoeba histolytica HM-1:IMSS]GAT94719.1 hypothetical protein CL6EHI_008590 [Entamoeba histolytica]|eukprot:XP_651150.2 hypothetical protein EHI_008590 [Entamoeba histolytica HM-1:IMSS]